MNRSSGAQSDPVLEVRNLSILYETDQGPQPTVRSVNMQLRAGEIYGLVGESGSGKTTLARGIVQHLPANGRATGDGVFLDGENLLGLPRSEMRRVWGSRITMVHQDPNTAINPSIVIGEQIAEVARVHLGMSRRDAQARAVEMLGKVRIADPESVARRYAHQLSGGMLQRVLIAIALTTNPRLLIMDEPTTALDVTTEAVILDLVRELLAEYRTAVLYITHNLGVVARISNRVGVMYAGELMEEGFVRPVFKQMLHPYTVGLLGSVPRLDTRARHVSLNTIPGRIPRPTQLPPGCIFEPRCPLAKEACRVARPPLIEAEPDHRTACIRWRVLRDEGERAAMPAEATATSERAAETPVVLETENLRKYFAVGARVLDLVRGRRRAVRAVDGISLHVRQGRTMGLVGESGCGKTTYARCIAGLEEATDGTIKLRGERVRYGIGQRTPNQLKQLQMVFQNPDASLNPQLTVGESVGRPLAQLGRVPRAEIPAKVAALFAAVNLPEDYIGRLPHELSGGEKQRAAIARAFAAHPSLMILDEPISSLDVSVQASLMNLLKSLQAREQISYLFISHDLAAVLHLSDWIGVVYLGRLWELGPPDAVFSPPFHPYTEALLSALPIPDPDALQERIRLEGAVPSAVDIPTGCRFHTRCPRKLGAICETQEPPWQDLGGEHRICCHIPAVDLLRLQTAPVHLPE